MGSLGAKIRDRTEFELKTQPTEVFLPSFTRLGGVQREVMREEDLHSLSIHYALVLKARGFTYVILFKPQKQPYVFNTTEL